eukprot:CAMPEP_0113325508 /NCGR_PEP_ID=MMETSP0010_2-20120614/17823_1 /TAXON_ID=216773 ORGANISM="Corethron hystrix, Strain 308" /NCGR_SAMPLE_ID=MMETSP0010_2 /ASSEMBLY_ACC=CAM_ASM_000155 /LENGTH=136 /DNA_ID=CAMNT_0000185373 /DNA_START=76 /DNA_END=482 /DNA_ORIENTATION=+ /assembly_acc=CAM_ASM_000155
MAEDDLSANDSSVRLSRDGYILLGVCKTPVCGSLRRFAADAADERFRSFYFWRDRIFLPLSTGLFGPTAPPPSPSPPMPLPNGIGDDPPSASPLFASQRAFERVVAARVPSSRPPVLTPDHVPEATSLVLSELFPR